jgi:hypothetical protein
VWKWRRKQTLQHRALIHELLNFQSSSLISRCRKRAGKRWIGDKWLTVHFTTLFQKLDHIAPMIWVITKWIGLILRYYLALA